MAGFCVRENDKIILQPYGDRGYTDEVNVKDLKTRLDIDIFLKMLPDIFPAFLKRLIPQEDFIVHRFYTAHGVTSSSAFFRGRGLCTAFAAIIVQGKSICLTRSS